LSKPRLDKPEVVDLWHLVVGVATLLCPIKLASIAMAVVYVAYQVSEKESTLRTVRDLVMFLCGALIGYLVVK